VLAFNIKCPNLDMLVFLQDYRREQLVTRLKDFVHDYESFLYGKSVLRPEELYPEHDLSVETAGLFTSAQLANIFFRYNRPSLVLK
jgi:hypothetical protein